MPGVVFLITIPTANYEKELLNGWFNSNIFVFYNFTKSKVVV